MWLYDLCYAVVYVASNKFSAKDKTEGRHHRLLVSLFLYGMLDARMSLTTDGGNRPVTEMAYTPFLKPSARVEQLGVFR